MVALIATTANVVRADFADGVTAYEAGDYKEAFDEWLPLAQNNDPAAMRNIGHIYRRGLGVDQDFKKAMNWYKRAATLGIDRAQANVGDMYLKGEGVPQDYEQAAQWFARAAQQGHVLSQYNLGLLLENGLGVEKNDELALGWYEEAAQAGYAPAIEKAAALKSGVVVAKAGTPAEQSEPAREAKASTTAVEPEESLKVAPVVATAAVSAVVATEVIRSSDTPASETSKSAEAAPETVQKQGFYDALKSLAKEKPAAVAATAVAVPVVAANQEEDTLPAETTSKDNPEIKVAAVAAVPTAVAVTPQSSTQGNAAEATEPTAKTVAAPAPTSAAVPKAAAAASAVTVSTKATGQNGLTLEEKLEMADLAYTLKEYQQSLSIWAVLAQQNNAEAQYRLGRLFFSGHAVPIDRVRAYYWWEKAKDNGSADASVALANLEKSLTHMEIRQIQRTN
ncbi:MAG: hypothetical protein V7723_11740 [Sneathiella sp.]|uniref:tetratricopeptide repeat protein n=1 Tax=Sneathiella sp. TaxID=1964365 RepID=UPI0030019B03